MKSEEILQLSQIWLWRRIHKEKDIKRNGENQVEDRD